MVSLAHGGVGSDVLKLLAGWSGQETSGRWSSGTDSALRLNMNLDSEGRKLGVRIKGIAYVNEQHPKQRFAVRINGQAVDDWNVVYPHSIVERIIPLHAGIDRASGSLLIEFHFPDAMSPCKLALSQDCRLLSLHLTGIGIEYLD